MNVPVALARLMLAISLLVLAGCSRSCECHQVPADASDFGISTITLVWSDDGKAHLIEHEYGTSRRRYIGRIESEDRKVNP